MGISALKSRFALPVLGGVGFILLWGGLVEWFHPKFVPSPLAVLAGIGELVEHGLLLNYVVASLFRVTCGFGLGFCVGLPLGMAVGWWPPLHQALNPVIQVLRPISPIAWTPFAIFWFGVGDLPAVFIIFLSSVFPLTVSIAAAVQNIPQIYLRVAENHGVRGFRLFQLVIFPAILPQIITSVRITLGVAWLVVVAAEMIAINSGLGYLIVDARNAGKRDDLVAAGMLLIGLIGLSLDLLIRQIEGFEEVRWGYSRLKD